MCRIISRVKNPSPFVHAAYGVMEAETFCEEHSVVMENPHIEGPLCLIGKIEKVFDEKMKEVDKKLMRLLCGK